MLIYLFVFLISKWWQWIEHTTSELFVSNIISHHREFNKVLFSDRFVECFINWLVFCLSIPKIIQKHSTDICVENVECTKSFEHEHTCDLLGFLKNQLSRMVTGQGEVNFNRHWFSYFSENLSFDWKCVETPALHELPFSAQTSCWCIHFHWNAGNETFDAQNILEEDSRPLQIVPLSPWLNRTYAHASMSELYIKWAVNHHILSSCDLLAVIHIWSYSLQSRDWLASECQVK